jgi:hypothetical protein
VEFIRANWIWLLAGTAGVALIFATRSPAPVEEGLTPTDLQALAPFYAQGTGLPGYTGQLPVDTISASGSNDNEFRLASRQLDVQEMVARNALEEARLAFATAQYTTSATIVQGFLGSPSRLISGNVGGLDLNLMQLNWLDARNMGISQIYNDQTLAAFERAARTTGAGSNAQQDLFRGVLPPSAPASALPPPTDASAQAASVPNAGGGADAALAGLSGYSGYTSFPI